MHVDLPSHEAHVQELAGRVTALQRLEAESHLLLEENPFQPDVIAVLDLIEARRCRALRALLYAHWALRLACAACLRAAEHDLNTLGCAGHMLSVAIT